MFPKKIDDFVMALTKKTSAGELSWKYDDNRALVETATSTFSASLRYAFSDINEMGEFVLVYCDKADNKEYRFYTNQEYADYEHARVLYDVAKSSELKLPF